MTKGFTDGMNPSAFDNNNHQWIYRRIHSVGISYIHRQISDGLSSSAFYHNYRWIYWRIYSVGISITNRQSYRWKVVVSKWPYHRWNKNPSVYFNGKLFFWHTKSVGKWFFCFSNQYSDGMGYHRWKERRRTYSVGNNVNK